MDGRWRVRERAISEASATPLHDPARHQSSRKNSRLDEQRFDNNWFKFSILLLFFVYFICVKKVISSVTSR